MVATQPFHAGEFALRPLTGDEDVARGFVTGVVATPEHLQEKFNITARESKALVTVLPELQKSNPWHAAYTASLGHVDEIRNFIEQLKSEGCLAPRIPEEIKTAAGNALKEELGGEQAVLFVPAEAYEAGGDYEKLRVCANAICRARHARPLPPEWQNVHESDLLDADGTPMWKLPQCLRANATFTKISWQDPHMFQKIFIRQFAHGTGGYRSALDAHPDMKHFALHTLLSLDGEFLDDADGGEFCFFFYELNMKRKLYTDYVGRYQHAANADSHGQSRQAIYSHERYSHRLAHLLPNSPEVLRNWKYVVQHLCRPGNLGPPTSMTTIVSNAHASTIWAHVEKGALSTPNPEETLRYFTAEDHKRNLNEHVVLQTLDYRRRRREHLATAYSYSRDGLRGRIPNRLTRNERQQRGHHHSHTNEFAERCGKAHDDLIQDIPMVAHAATPTSSSHHVGASTQMQVVPATACRSVSRWCLRANEQCILPHHCNGAPYHVTAHCAEATAEMIRPYPLGTLVKKTAPVLEIGDETYENTLRALARQFWSSERMERKKPGEQHLCEGTFLERCARLSANVDDRTLGSAMNFRDLAAAFYYRYLQMRTMPHVCRLGYCRPSWDVACKFGLPATTITEEMYFDEERRRTVPRKIHLDDDAYNKSTSIECLVDTLMNVQVNAHHPDGDVPNVSYPVKYSLKPEKSLKVSLTHETDDLVLKHIRGQFVSIGEVVETLIGDPVVDSTFSIDVCPLLYPSWIAVPRHEKV